jgi:hypothetical protein
MLKVNVTHVNFFMKKMEEHASRQEIKQAFRYYMLAFHELRRQRHLALAAKIHDHMSTVIFKIELDDAFATHTEINN